jgi:phosphomannomutase
MAEIKFGTDGWRGIIADDFTFANVRRAAGAVAHYVLKNEDPSRGVLVGYDTRFGSRDFARAAAEVIAAAGIPVGLSNDVLPTPAISYCVKYYGAAGGVVITSSHNPASWNGLKFKANFGGSATPAIIRKIEAELDSPPPKGKPARIEEADFKKPYLEAITRFADLDLIGRSGFKVAVDYMYGAGRLLLGNVLRQHGLDVVEIRSEINPLFPGINPEPIEPHVAMLQETVVREKCDAGFCNDGDADRIGAVAEDGSFVDAHKCYAVLLWWLLEYRKEWTGAVTRAFNTTRMLDRIARKYGRELIEHGIGFKYVCDVVLSGKEVLIGGEESGGIGIPRHLPERDGVLNALLLANAMAESRMTLGQIVAHLQKEFGPHYYGRRDLHIDEEIKQAAIQRADSGQVTELGRFKVLRKENLDGVKFFLDAPTNGGGAEAWVLMRASGTEPLMRIYCEAAAPDLVQEILASAVAFVEQRATAA